MIYIKVRSEVDSYDSLKGSIKWVGGSLTSNMNIYGIPRFGGITVTVRLYFSYRLYSLQYD